MNKHYHTLIIGGGCLGCACAIAIQRRLGKKAGQVMVIEKKVLGAGLSSRHSAIVRSANASVTAARMGKVSTAYWQTLKSLWGVNVAFEKSGAIWATRAGKQGNDSWINLQNTLEQADIRFDRLSHDRVSQLTGKTIKISADENYFFEPDVLQLDSADILHTLQVATRRHKVDVIEHCEVIDFEFDTDSAINAVHTRQGTFYCDNVINAAGGWSADLFARIDITIPVALEPVYAANFLVSTQDIPEKMPIIADFVNHAYFRRWRGSILHMHQPRSRDTNSIRHAFNRTAMNPGGADIIYDALSYSVNHKQLENYLTKIENRFPAIGRPVFAGGFQSFFDITPDLQFILGADNQARNLFHCLGAGQSLKYAPIFGELIADQVTAKQECELDIDYDAFSISRFNNKPINEFWTKQVDNSQNCL